MHRRRPRPSAVRAIKPPAVPSRRLWLFRLTAALVAPALLLILLESLLRLTGIGYPTAFFLPMQIKGRECLIENERFGWRFFSPEMARTPYPVVLPREKAPGTVRVFVFGESAAYGDPQPEFGLPRMLEALLSLRFPERHFEVVNTGMTGINSHVILPIAEDCADKQGDFWVIYMGNNEVVGPFGSGTVFGPKAPPRALVRWSLAFKATRIGQLFDRGMRALRKRPDRESVWGGMPMFVKNHVREDDPRMATVYANFQENLDDIINLGMRHGAQIVLSTVARNVRDCAPFASEHRQDFSTAERARWDELYGMGIQAQQAGDAGKAADYFGQAASLDGSYADLQFRWGQCSLAMRNPGEALKHFNQACDADALRFRSDSRINDIIQQASLRHQGVRMVDAQGALAAESPDHLVGDEDLYEHVHLNFEGNYKVARALAQQIAPTNAIWPSEADCARRLSFTDFNRSEGEGEILQRLNDPPYTSQLNHAEEYRKFKRGFESLLPASRPEALQQDKLFCRQAVAEWPDDWILRQNLGKFEEKTGDNAAAVVTFERITELLPQSHEAWRSLAVALGRMNRTDEAIAALNEALRTHPDDVAELEGMAELTLGQGKTNEAEGYFKRILKLQPFFGPAHLGMGKILDASGRHEEAQAEFHKAMEARINTPGAFSSLGKFFFSKGDYASALTNFVDSLRLNPSDSDAHFNLALTLDRFSRTNEAESHYAEAVRLNPNFAAGHFCLGLARGRRGDNAGAMKEFAEAVRLSPDLVEARLNLGIAFYNQHRDEEARQQFEGVLQRAADNKTALAYLRGLERRAGEAPQP